MEKNLKGTIKGGVLFKKVMVPIILSVVLIVVLLSVSIFSMLPEMNVESVLILLLVVALAYLLVLFIIVYTRFQLIQETLGHISYERSWSCDMPFWGFVGRAIGGAYLCLVTLGIWLPWYYKMMYEYILNATSYEGNRIKFLGTVGEIIVKFLLVVILPQCLNFFISWTSMRHILGSLLCSYVALVGSLSIFIEWITRVEYRGVVFTLEGGFGGLVKVVALQSFLFIITFGIYGPAALVVIYRYVMKNLKGQDRYAFDFSGNTGKGFLKIWGQTLLCLITLFIYFPWAYKNIMNGFIDATSVRVSLEKGEATAVVLEASEE